ncbi:DUF2512 family protein [Exiguobacterium flavidum]|uniref:DUF2512 family protein n=1 Tax=Exiguobacterium flavidum TaxID=2184695 RepID=UPI000DF7D1A0|nr:DUF2512 family protein [Exiguobacterium flavidum]
MNINHGKALLLKLPIMMLLFFLIQSVLYEITWYHPLWIAAVIGLVTYVALDLFVLPKVGTYPAAAADLVVVYFLTWLLLMMVDVPEDSNRGLIALLCALAVFLVELLFFHRFMLKNGDRVVKREHLSEDKTKNNL